MRMSMCANQRLTMSSTISKANGISMPWSNAPLTSAGRPPGSTSLMRTVGNRGKIATHQAFKNWAPPSPLGVPAPRVTVIDADLGQSGQDSQRPGFQELVTAVSLGRVGLIVAYEASRLARKNTDWYTLLDIATVVG